MATYTIKSNFSPVLDEVKSLKIPANAKLLFSEILKLSMKKGFCFASNTYLSKVFNISTCSIIRLLNILEKNKLIKKEYETKTRRKIFITLKSDKLNNNVLVKKFPEINKRIKEMEDKIEKEDYAIRIEAPNNNEEPVIRIESPKKKQEVRQEVRQEVNTDPYLKKPKKYIIGENQFAKFFNKETIDRLCNTNRSLFNEDNEDNKNIINNVPIFEESKNIIIDKKSYIEEQKNFEEGKKRNLDMFKVADLMLKNNLTAEQAKKYLDNNKNYEINYPDDNINKTSSNGLKVPDDIEYMCPKNYTIVDEKDDDIVYDYDSPPDNN